MTRLLQLLLIVTLPLVFLLGTVRALMATDALLRFEYYRPGFTPDGYRFVPTGPLWNAEERLRYGTQTLVWLRDGRPAAELAALRQVNGEPLYRDAEVRHMADVQRVIGWATWVLVVAAVVVVLAGGWLAYGRTRHAALAGALVWVGIGTWLFFGALAFLLLGGVNGETWDSLFVGFHQLFFPGGNWQFLYSDTLIRLFPEQLWFDFAAIVLGTTLVLAAACGVGGYRWRRRMHD